MPRRVSGTADHHRRAVVVGVLALAAVFVAVVVAVVVAARGEGRVELPPVRPLVPGSLKGVTVVIDPGHGGTDPGAVEGGVVEAALNYRLAAVVTRELRAAGAAVRSTVSSKALVLGNADRRSLVVPRDAYANDASNHPLRAGSDDLESLYARASVAGHAWGVFGPEVVFISLHHDTLASTERRGGFVLYDRRRSASPCLGSAIARQLRASGLVHDRPSRPQPRELAVLNPRHNPVPERVLFEVATISNKADRRAARDPRWRQRVAWLIGHAIETCT